MLACLLKTDTQPAAPSIHLCPCSCSGNPKSCTHSSVPHPLVSVQTIRNLESSLKDCKENLADIMFDRSVDFGVLEQQAEARVSDLTTELATVKGAGEMFGAYIKTANAKRKCAACLRGFTDPELQAFLALVEKRQAGHPEKVSGLEEDLRLEKEKAARLQSARPFWQQKAKLEADLEVARENRVKCAAPARPAYAPAETALCLSLAFANRRSQNAFFLGPAALLDSTLPVTH